LKIIKKKGEEKIHFLVRKIAPLYTPKVFAVLWGQGKRGRRAGFVSSLGGEGVPLSSKLGWFFKDVGTKGGKFQQSAKEQRLVSNWKTPESANS